MHALIHNLVTVSALIGRTPVIPNVPCGFVKTVQQRPDTTPSDSARQGVSHPSIVLTGPKDSATCHLAPGTWRPGGPDQCYHNRILSQFDYERFVTMPYVTNATSTPLPAITLPRSPLEPTAGEDAAAFRSTIDIEALRKLCQRASAQIDAPILQLDGLLPVRDFLLDAPIGAAEFDSESARLASGRPRWRSLLQRSTLDKLADACPGARTLIEQRKACVGYFLAE